MARIILVALAAVLGGCSRIWVPDALEQTMGQMESKQILSEMPEVTDSPWGPFVQDAGKKLASVSERPDVDYQFHIVSSPDINAFAAADGEIFVTTSLLAAMGHDSQAVAAVLGHEIGHVARRHGAEELQSEIGWTATLVTIFGINQSLTRALAGLAGQLVDIGYGRDREMEADLCSIRYLTRLGYPPSTGLKFLEIFEARERDNMPGLERYLHRHPPTADRLAYAKAYAAKLAAQQSH